MQSNTIYREECVGTSNCTYETLLSLSPDVWYRGRLTIDSSDRFIAEAWRVSTPGVVGVSEAVHTDWVSLEWKFKDFSQSVSGTQKLDDYRQSLLYGTGQRAKMVDGSGSTSWSYDRRGQVIAERKQIDSSVFYTRWGYNAAGLQSWMRYPGGAAGETGELVTTSYLPQMLADGLSGSYDYVLGTTYDAAGRATLRELGNTSGNALLQTVYGYYDWDEQGGRLDTLETGAPATPGSLQALEYFYDAGGNITGINDTLMGDPYLGGWQYQTFEYDALHRLTLAKAEGGYLNRGNYGPESYTYDPDTGNLASKTGVGTYTYTAQTNCSGEGRTIAHAVSAAGGNTYGYDCNGNQTTRVTGGITFTLSYDAENRLVGVKKNDIAIASFAHNGDGARVKGVITETQTTTTLFVGGHFEWSGSTGTMVKYYAAGGARIAMRVGTGTSDAGLTYLFGDHLGSTHVSYKADGSQTITQLYKAWGEPRYATASLSTKYTYTGQYSHADDIFTQGVTEGFGLLFYNARWLDPALGRFNQPDTLIPQSQGVQGRDRYRWRRTITQYIGHNAPYRS